MVNQIVRLICPACNKGSNELVEHHWYELPNLQIHTKRICQTCNAMLRTESFYPRRFYRDHKNLLHHIMPAWEKQLEFLHGEPKEEGKMEVDVKAIRKRLGLTQGELAEKLGVTRMTIYNWENREKRPSNLAKRQLARLANGKKERK